MFKAKLAKALMLGICMSALTTGVAFAQMTPQSVPGKGAAVSEEENALYAKQKEIDEYLFNDYADDAAKLGFTVNYTGVNGDVIEIGISPYSDKNADYLYSLFGKDAISVIESDQNLLYDLASSSGVAVGSAVDPAAPDAGSGSSDANTGNSAAGGATTDIQPLDDQVYTTTSATDAVTDTNGKAPDAPVTDGRMYKGGDAQAQDGDAAANEDDTIFYANAADVKTVSAAESADVVKTADEDSNAVSTSLIILIIAAGAAVVGGSIIAVNKKKADK